MVVFDRLKKPVFLKESSNIVCRLYSTHVECVVKLERHRT